MRMGAAAGTDLGLLLISFIKISITKPKTKKRGVLIQHSPFLMRLNISLVSQLSEYLSYNISINHFVTVPVAWAHFLPRASSKALYSASSHIS